jgi:hypothetical protein
MQSNRNARVAERDADSMVPVVIYAARSQAEEPGKDSTGDQLTLVWISSRLARGSGLKGEARSVFEVFAYLRRHGVTLRSVEDDAFVTSSMLVGFAAEQAEKYSRDLAANVRRGIDSRVRTGRGASPVTGTRSARTATGSSTSTRRRWPGGSSASPCATARIRVWRAR